MELEDFYKTIFIYLLIIYNTIIKNAVREQFLHGRLT